jgi:ferredoxin
MKRNRRLVQCVFLVLTVIGVFLLRANAEAWCPFGGVEALYTYVNEGNMPCSLAVSNFYILAAVILLTLLLRRAFCGYMCPLGALSEWLRSGTKRMKIKPLTVPRRVDAALSLLKYPLLGLILYATYSASELLFRGYDPCYALISRHGEDITFWAYVVAGAVIVVSLLVTMPFCRWFCPLGAVFNLFSRFGLARVSRDTEACLNCRKCDKVCPMAIEVSQMNSVTCARCISCLNCVAVCPVKEQGALTWGPPKVVGRPWPQTVLIALVFLCVAGAVVTAYAWPLPSYVREREGIVAANNATLELQVQGLNCRGSATKFWFYIDRDDFSAIDGYLKVEAWPQPGLATVRIIYDPTRTDEAAIKEAITEPYYRADDDFWWPSEFEIEGYDPLGLE